MNRGGEGFLSICEVLRSRQRLPPGEVAYLLAQLPGLIDGAGARLSPTPLLHEVFVEFADEPDLGRLVGQDVRSWPAFRLRLGAALAETFDLEATIFGADLVQRGTPAMRFAGLLYDMLGGRVRYEELIAGRYSPLAALGEKGNEVLKLAVQPGAFADCCSVWDAWRGSIETLATAPAREQAPGWKIPAALLAIAQPADVLELAPAEGDSPPVRVVARPEFRIGRSRKLSDLAILPREATESARCVVEELSRVHAIAVHGPNGPALRDGDGQRASSNGSVWLGQPLSATEPAPIAGPGLLVLSPKGCRYEIEVTPLLADPADQAEIINMAQWSGAAAAPSVEPPSPCAAVAFATPPPFTIMRSALWLRSSVRLEAQPGGEISWGSQAETAQLLLYRARTFWIVRTSARAAVRVGEVELAPGEIAPLASGAILQLGATTFRLEMPRG